MIFKLFSFKKKVDPRIDPIYTALVEQSRWPDLYKRYEVPDTLEGRYDMLVLHMALYLRRLNQETGPIRDLGRDVLERMFEDMDHALREMGVGDLSVPKKMKSMAEVFYGRASVYDAALTELNIQNLKEALLRNVYGGAADKSYKAAELSEYIRGFVRELEHKSVDELTVNPKFSV